MVLKNLFSELHGMGWFVLGLGIFFLAIPYIFNVSEFNSVLYFTIVGLIFIHIAIIFRENLRFDEII